MNSNFKSDKKHWQKEKTKSGKISIRDLKARVNEKDSVFPELVSHLANSCIYSTNSGLQNTQAPINRVAIAEQNPNTM